MVTLPNSVFQITGQVINPALAQSPDGQPGLIGVERNQSLMVSEIHGKYGVAVARGNVFFASSGLAGTVLKLSAATMASVNFAVLNPVGSGKNLELLYLSYQVFGTGTQIVGQQGLAFQTNIASAGVPTTTTAGTINNSLIGAGATSVASFFTVATLTNSAIGAQFPHYWFTTMLNAAVGAVQPQNTFDLAGMFVMPPGTLVVPVGAVTGTEIEAAITLVWAEWPI